MDLSKIPSLISKCHTAASSFLEEELNKRGFPKLSSSHGNILFLLSSSEKISMNQLATMINRSKSTVTALVNKLESVGFVERTKDSKDNRQIYISLSEKGKKYKDDVSVISSELEKKCLSHFSEEEKKELYISLSKILDNFSKEK